MRTSRNRLAISTRAWGACVVVPPAAVGVALFTQHALGMQPCPWCVLQRAIFLAIAVAALFGLALARLRVALVRRAPALPMLALALGGVWAALYQHFVAAASQSCQLSLAERIVRESGLAEALPAVFEPMASCADAASAKLLGVPYEFYSLTLFVGLAAAAIWLLRRG